MKTSGHKVSWTNRSRLHSCFNRCWKHLRKEHATTQDTQVRSIPNGEQVKKSRGLWSNVIRIRSRCQTRWVDRKRSLS